ncbi:MULTISPECIES: hypothetical protein [unclassified Acinetobacter]|uniref:hypothetical protein n=1 Tax=unclassified Acinetobacter TaxID=196816 RepID=UPI00244D1D81|nr:MULTISPECIES: hypothetical protein [unclassified Acinetobacter]MDH0030389.1 hypothetical protein [Acinetobacter sp. GD04021]MDH0885957.1 hypothetical protein [Acinetobacter sp. GD03873]MDH1082577.1 hypothetical protein [Acinetobacter sp. GD03983]MDH2189031.1 hypothetical protein [Acinetobacter sp. GD03645]MDH2202219.1 hypothetical protein [Acinetobacter sp. GD03647]
MNISKQKIQPDWWTKTLVGLFLGLSFAVAIGALVFLLTLPHVERSLPGQLAMWSIPWVWLFVFFIAYFIPKGWQSLVIFSIANIIAYALLFWLRG